MELKIFIPIFKVLSFDIYLEYLRQNQWKYIFNRLCNRVSGAVYFILSLFRQPLTVSYNLLRAILLEINLFTKLLSTTCFARQKEKPLYKKQAWVAKCKFLRAVQG